MPTSIRLDPKTDQRLDGPATRTGRSRVFHLRAIIARGLDDLEDCSLSAEVIERIRKGEDAAQTLEAVERELGLAD